MRSMVQAITQNEVHFTLGFGHCCSPDSNRRRSHCPLPVALIGAHGVTSAPFNDEAAPYLAVYSSSIQS